MIPSPIHRALSVISAHGVQSLLMGGQACILYGAAEFSRDADIAILATPENLRRLQAAVTALEAAVVAVPPFEARYLARGHAVHFRCEREDVRGLRIDVMARMRGVDEFPRLWERRTTLTIAADGAPSLDVDLLALPDLVAAKKTQRDKDWPMLRRLVETNYFEFREQPTPERIAFWLSELRTGALLFELVRAVPKQTANAWSRRAAVAAAISGDVDVIEVALSAEQEHERALDRAYWAPLRAELESLRRSHED